LKLGKASTIKHVRILTQSVSLALESGACEFQRKRLVILTWTLTGGGYWLDILDNFGADPKFDEGGYGVSQHVRQLFSKQHSLPGTSCETLLLRLWSNGRERVVENFSIGFWSGIDRK
jgi:hypothetical protein